MSRPAWAGKRRDANEPEICGALELAGFGTWRLNDPCDVLIWPKSGGRFGLLEIKDPSQSPSRRRLTKAQELFFRCTEGCTRAKVETVEEALAFAETLRA